MPEQWRPSRERLSFGVLLTANAASLMGSAMTLVAVPLFVLDLAKGPLGVAAAGFVNAAPLVLAGVLGGTIVDRLGHKRASVLADLLAGATLLAIPLLHDTIGVPFGILLGLVFLRTLVDVPGMIARESLVPEVSARAGLTLDSANSLYEALPRLALLVGPAVAAGLIPVIGTLNVLYVDAATFLVSGLLIAVGVRAQPVEPKERAPSSYLSDLRAGFRLIGKDGLLLALFGTVLVTNLLDEPFPVLLLPFYADTVFEQASLAGLLIAATAAGALLGTLGYGLLATRTPLSRRAVFLFAFSAVAAVRVALVALPGLAGALALLFCAGLASGPVNPLMVTVVQQRVPVEMRARALGAITAIAFAGMPFGVGIAGLVLDAFGLQATLAAVACAWVVLVLGLTRVQSLRELDEVDRRRAAPAFEGSQ